MFAWFDELKTAFLKFSVVDKFTEANCDCKKFVFPKCVGGGRGQSTKPVQVKISYLKNDQNSTYINLFSYFVVWSAIINSLIFILMKNSFKFIFIPVLYRIVIENACDKSKSPIKT